MLNKVVHRQHSGMWPLRQVPAKRHGFHCYVFVVCLKVAFSISEYESMNVKQGEPENLVNLVC